MRIRGTLLAVTVFILTFTANSGVHATISSFCPSPTQVATDWRGEIPGAQCQIGEGAKLCRAWIGTCKKVVRVTAKCLVTQVTMDAKVEKARCKLDSVVDQKQCRKDAAFQAKTVKARLKPDRDSALSLCTGHLATCIATCEN